MRKILSAIDVALRSIRFASSNIPLGEKSSFQTQRSFEEVLGILASVRKSLSPHPEFEEFVSGVDSASSAVSELLSQFQLVANNNRYRGRFRVGNDLQRCDKLLSQIKSGLKHV